MNSPQKNFSISTRSNKKEMSSEEKEGASGNISRAEIKELCFLWFKTEVIVKKWHPNKVVVNRNINLFNDNVTDHFKKFEGATSTWQLWKSGSLKLASPVSPSPL